MRSNQRRKGGGQTKGKGRGDKREGGVGDILVARCIRGCRGNGIVGDSPVASYITGYSGKLVEEWEAALLPATSEVVAVS